MFPCLIISDTNFQVDNSFCYFRGILKIRFTVTLLVLGLARANNSTQHTTKIPNLADEFPARIL